MSLITVIVKAVKAKQIAIARHGSMVLAYANEGCIYTGECMQNRLQKHVIILLG